MLFRSTKKNIELTDTMLLERYRYQGDKQAFGTFFERYSHLVYSVCCKYIKDKDTAGNMAMQVFEKLMKQLGEFTPDNPAAWLHTITKNECLMWLRKADKEQATEAIEESSGYFMDFTPALHHSEEGEKTLQLLERALARLPDEQHVCVKLFYLEDKTYKEIEQSTGYTYNEVKSYIQNGKRNLKQLIQENNV